jgi:hypothetical protein
MDDGVTAHPIFPSTASPFPSARHLQVRDPATELPPKEMLEAVQEKQAALLRETLRQDMRARELQDRRIRRAAKLPPYRSFRSEEEVAAISQRALGSEPVYPAEPASEGEQAAATAAGGAPAGEGAAGASGASAAAASPDVLRSADADSRLVADVLSAGSGSTAGASAAAPRAAGAAASAVPAAAGAASAPSDKPAPAAAAGAGAGAAGGKKGGKGAGKGDAGR